MTSTGNYKKKLIEVAIPLEAINAASAREKSIRHGHPSTLHLWWARRPLAACRAVLFAQLVDDPSSDPKSFPTEDAIEAERKRLFGIIEDLVLWENSTNDEVLEKARVEIRRSCEGKLPPIYDPFSGGGSIPLEAQRLGLSALGSDLNPVAVMIGKALIEFPNRFLGKSPVHPGAHDRLHYNHAQCLAEDIRYYGELLKAEAFKEIGNLYPKVSIPEDFGGGEATVVAYLWCRTVPSPNPAFNGTAIPLVRTFDLLRKANQSVWVEPVVDRSNGSYRFEVRSGTAEAPAGTVNRNGAICIISGDAVPLKYIRERAQAGEMRQKLLAVVVDTPSGRKYISPTDAIERTAFLRSPDWRPSARIPEKHRNFQTPLYGMPTFGDVFTDRQAVAVNQFIKSLQKIREEIAEDAKKAFNGELGDSLLNGGASALAYTQALTVYLAFAISKATTRNCSLSIWEPGMGRLAGALGRQALPMQWAFAETNPFANAGGDISGTAVSVAEVLDALNPNAEGLEFQRNASEATKLSVNPVISTDPPYYDNIEYAELSDFFYVWLRRTLADEFPDLFQTLVVPKAEELVASTNRYGGKENAEKHFMDGMSLAIANMAEEGREDYPTTIYYAFKQSEVEEDGISSPGWASFLTAILNSGFSVVGTWPLRTEATNALKKGMNALASSVVLVCRKRPVSAETVSRAEFVRSLKRELPPAIAKLQAANIAPADMPQSAIGPGMGVYSRYAAVLESDDSPLTVKAALQLINRELDEYLGGIQGEFDADTRFAISWYEQCGLKAGEYGAANSIAQARGISVESAKHAGIVESAAGKVRILSRDEMGTEWDPLKDQHITVWECCQHLIRTLEAGGEYAAASLLKRMGSEKGEAVKDLAYCLHAICEKRSDTKEASSYNTLIAVWAELTRQAASMPDVIVGDRQISMDI